MRHNYGVILGLTLLDGSVLGVISYILTLLHKLTPRPALNHRHHLPVPQPPQLPLRHMHHQKEDGDDEDDAQRNGAEARALGPVHVGVHGLASGELPGHVAEEVRDKYANYAGEVADAERNRAREDVVDGHDEEGRGVLENEVHHGPRVPLVIRRLLHVPPERRPEYECYQDVGNDAKLVE